MNAVDLIHSVQQAYPVSSYLATLLLGGVLGPKLLKYAEGPGLKKLVDLGDRQQEVLLQRAGLTPAQIRAVRKHEVADMRVAADDLEANITAEEAAEAAAVAAPPAAPPAAA